MMAIMNRGIGSSGNKTFGFWLEGHELKAQHPQSATAGSATESLYTQLLNCIKNYTHLNSSGYGCLANSINVKWCVRDTINKIVIKKN